MFKKITLTIIASLTLTSCFSYYDLGGVDSILSTTMGQKEDVNVKDAKMGEACTTNVLFLFAFGDSSIETAKRNGYIKDVVSVQTKYKHFVLYLPFFQKGCTIVRGY